MQTSFSVIILTLNEADRIEACIKSVRSTEQVFVVDSGSSDDTVLIAESLGAISAVNRPRGVFLIAEQRNWALENLPIATEWVLFLDADEIATPEFLAAVEKSIQSGEARDGFWAAPKFVYQGTWLKRFMGFPNWHSRVLHRGTRLVGGTWETFPSEGSFGYISEPYLHFPDDRGLEDWVTRHLRYARARASASDTGSKPRQKIRLQKVAERFGAFRPLAVLFYYLLIRRGVLDGGSVWSYARRTMIYELMVLEAADDNSKRTRGPDGDWSPSR